MISDAVVVVACLGMHSSWREPIYVYFVLCIFVIYQLNQYLLFCLVSWAYFTSDLKTSICRSALTFYEFCREDKTWKHKIKREMPWYSVGIQWCPKSVVLRSKSCTDHFIFSQIILILIAMLLFCQISWTLVAQPSHGLFNLATTTTIILLLWLE